MTPFTSNYYSVFLADNYVLLHNYNIVIKIRKLTLMQYYHPILRPHSNFTNCPSNFLLAEEFYLESCVTFSRYVSSICTNSSGFPWHSQYCWILQASFIKCLLVWVCLMLHHDWILLMHLWQEYHGGDAVFFSLPSQVHSHLFDSFLVTCPPWSLVQGGVCKAIYPL